MERSQFLRSLVAYVSGDKKSIDVCGTIKEIKSFKNVIGASRQLFEALYKDGANLKEIMVLANQKKIAAEKYKKSTGNVWPL